MFDPSGVDLPDAARRLIKSEVGARAITDLLRWYEWRGPICQDLSARIGPRHLSDRS